jgi:hypothetical protein
MGDPSNFKMYRHVSVCLADMYFTSNSKTTTLSRRDIRVLSDCARATLRKINLSIKRIRPSGIRRAHSNLWNGCENLTNGITISIETPRVALLLG